MSTANDVAEAAVLSSDSDEANLARQRAQHVQPRTALRAWLLPLSLSKDRSHLRTGTSSIVTRRLVEGPSIP